MYTKEKTVEKRVCSRTELKKCTQCAHGRRTQNNTVQCAAAGAGREYCLRPVCLNDLRPITQIRIMHGAWPLAGARRRGGGGFAAKRPIAKDRASPVPVVEQETAAW